jgi:hypothetical protein
VNKKEIHKLFLMINCAYPNFVVDDLKVSMWIEFTGDYPFDLAEKNLINHIRRSPFLPTVADITRPLRDPEHYIDYLQLKEETSCRLKKISEWQTKALPPGGVLHA